MSTVGTVTQFNISQNDHTVNLILANEIYIIYIFNNIITLSCYLVTGFIKIDDLIFV